MKPIGTPAFRPTADSIWNSFRISGKKHLLLTGSRQSGKTTLWNALLPPGTPGVVTYAVARKEVRLRETAAGEERVVGVYDERLPGTENKMRLCPEGFEEFGVEAVKRLMSSAGEWAAIDEIGYLECGCAAYTNALRRLMREKRVIAVVRSQDLPFLNELRADENTFCVRLDRPYGRMGCVVMASGMGVRFGGNKLTADFCGEPMFLRALAATEGIFAKRVVVTRHEDVAALCRSRGVDVILHDKPLRSDTVRIGLNALGDVDGCLFCPADQPLLRQETVASLAMSAANDPSCIFRPCHENTPGAPVLFPKWAFEELNCLPEGKGGGVLIKKYPDRVRLLPVRSEYELMDADDPETLGLLSRIR